MSHPSTPRASQAHLLQEMNSGTAGVSCGKVCKVMAGLYVTWEIAAFSSRSLTVLSGFLSQAGTRVYHSQQRTTPRPRCGAHSALPPRWGAGRGSWSWISYWPLMSWFRSSSHFSPPEGRVWRGTQTRLGETLEKTIAMSYPPHSPSM